MDTGDFLPRGKAVKCEADHSPQSSAGVKNLWNHTSTLPYILMMMCGMHQGNFSYFIEELILDNKIIVYFFTTTLRSVYWNIKQLKHWFT